MEVNSIYKGDSELILKSFEDSVFDSFVSDPPYGLKFMGKHWDYDVPSVSVFKEMYRTLKAGGYILIACGTRTQHRMAVNIEDAGFEIRDNISYFYDGSHEVYDFLNSLTEEQQRAFAKITNEAEPAVISWLYGSGFPKSLDISKAIDKQAGAEREVIGKYDPRSSVDGAKRKDRAIGGNQVAPSVTSKLDITAPSTDAAKQWEGWGTALKPAQEFWTLARKPLSESTVAENVLKHGTGGINIDACRIGDSGARSNGSKAGEDGYSKNEVYGKFKPMERIEYDYGRFPANVIFDTEMGKELDKQTGVLTSGASKSSYIQKESENKSMSGKNYERPMIDRDGDSGGASRFFYCAKADGFQRNKGLKGFDSKKQDESRKEGNVGGDNPRNRGVNERQNHHPTVKPIELMRYLVKLITPKGGLTCDPYCGSGTTLIGAKLELINYIGIEREKDYVDIAEARVAAWNPEKYLEQRLF